MEKIPKPPDFELDLKALDDDCRYQYLWICMYCKHRAECPSQWECSTLENLDNDNTENGDE